MHFELRLLQRCWFIAGPTAVGKTTLAIEIATRLGAEILSLDSMSLYRGMDIGTAKPSAEEQQRIPHHLVDILDPHEGCDVANYVELAHQAAMEIDARGKIPLFAGGTGLYLRSILRGVFVGPSADPEFRSKVEEEADGQPPGYLHEKLRSVDPASAVRLHPNDQRRLIRALEVYHVTGRPASVLQTQQPLPAADRPRHVYWLEPPRDWLYDRINRRVDAMIAEGLVDEVRALLARPDGIGSTARQALGYKEIIDHLDGRCTLDEAITAIKTRTRQFAKRQHTWFRNLEECTPIAVIPDESPSELADRLVALA
ncbi:IPP transferase [Maioricimonas rarisocia]|uniref:tRNA dimethylallyltransferase n=1 Tax=Maioricimonas rarisocia TaxID=2528026 RepID=A0A517Z4N5_9PLAN|nr:tRNA (adenosine(37)-N6)-dimethylallyltransferase MiaA [Maioricimonas rarisocia]QDU37451.1 IPP transferase [Maioricimonas rarisocia]